MCKMTVHEENTSPRTTIFVRNLPFETSAQKLEEEFSKFGPVKKAFVVKDKGKTCVIIIMLISLIFFTTYIYSFGVSSLPIIDSLCFQIMQVDVEDLVMFSLFCKPMLIKFLSQN